jgi:hypothetical protein
MSQRGPGSAPPDPSPGQPRLLDRVRMAIRARHYSLRTEEAYVAWIRSGPSDRPSSTAGSRGG